MARIAPHRVAWIATVALLFSALPRLTVSQQKPSTLRTSSSLVLVPVSPLDKSGHFISGLRAQDFQILVDGKPVDISHFDVVTENLPQYPPVSPVNPSTPNTFRNISESSAGESNLVIFLVDYLNTRMADRMALREELLKFFSTKLRPDQEIAVYGLTYSLALLQPFTRDPSSLTAVAKNLLKQKGQPPDPKTGRPLLRPNSADRAPSDLGEAEDWFTLQNARREYNIDQAQRAVRTLTSFRELAESFGGLPGKKTVLWLTGDASPLNPTLLYRNLPFDKSVETPDTSWWQTAKTYEALNAAGVSVFPVDVRGIINTGLYAAGEAQTHEEFQQSVRGSQPEDLSPYAQMTDFRQGEAANAVLAMDTVAAETGATVLAGSNDIGKLLERAHQLWANYYVLAFVPEKPADKNAAYHRIEVKVDRPGVHVLARRGYVTRPEALISSDSEIQRDLAEAAVSPIDLTSIALELSWENPRNQNDARHLPFLLTISSDVLLPASEGGAAYDLSVVAFVRDQSGKALESTARRLRGTLAASRVANARAYGVAYRAEFQTPSRDVYFGRVIVRDNLTGRVGTITLRLPATASKP